METIQIQLPPSLVQRMQQEVSSRTPECSALLNLFFTGATDAAGSVFG